MLLADGVPGDRTVTVHEGVDVSHIARGARRERARSAVAAASCAARRQRRRPRPAQGTALSHRSGAPGRAGDPGRAGSSFSARGSCANTSSAWSTSATSTSMCCCRGSAPTCSGCIKGFDVFAMSSVTEGLGTSLLDAMACATPIVATRTGGIPEIVEDGVTGLLVPPRDAPALARAIVRLLTDETRRHTMGGAGCRARERTLHGRADGGPDRGGVQAPRAAAEQYAAAASAARRR